MSLMQQCLGFESGAYVAEAIPDVLTIPNQSRDQVVIHAAAISRDYRLNQKSTTEAAYTIVLS